MPIPGEGSTVTVVKNQLAIMYALRTLLRHLPPAGRTDSMYDLGQRLQQSEYYLADCERRQQGAGR